ncbi:hypothetical protein, partial [Schlesneria sp.]|uniref:hypothetical protein n=1 Tax=Schlesneria sp. TaxID=2762018 RepID=UPI002F052223
PLRIEGERSASPTGSTVVRTGLELYFDNVSQKCITDAPLVRLSLVLCHNAIIGAHATASESMKKQRFRSDEGM